MAETHLHVSIKTLQKQAAVYKTRRSRIRKEFAKSISGIKVDCKKKCNLCCHQLVTIGFWEAFNIAHYVMEHMTAEGLASLEKELDRASDEFTEEIAKAGMRLPLLLNTGPELVQFMGAWERPCVFLKEEVCSIYKERPTACWSYFTESFEECRLSKERGGLNVLNFTYAANKMFALENEMMMELDQGSEAPVLIVPDFLPFFVRAVLESLKSGADFTF